MESINLDSYSNDQINNNSHLNFNISQVLNAIKNKKDARWFCLMNRNFFLFIELYMPDSTCFDFEFFLQVANGTKKVFYFLISCFHLMNIVQCFFHNSNI